MVSFIKKKDKATHGVKPSKKRESSFSSFAKLLSSFLPESNKMYYGLDIGFETINLAKILYKPRSKKIILKDYQYALIEEKNFDQIVQKFISQNRYLYNKKLNIGFTDDEVIYRLVSYPLLNDKETYSSLLNEIDRHTPFKRDECVFDYTVLEKDSKQQTLLIVCMRKLFVDRYVKLIEGLSLKNYYIGSKNTALTNFIFTNFQSTFLNEDKVHAVVNISRDSTFINIISGRKLKFSRNLSIGTNNIYAAILRNHLMTKEELFKIRSKIIVDDITKNPKEWHPIIETTRTILEIMTKEISNSFKYYATKNNEEIQNVFFMGEINKLKGVIDYFQELWPNVAIVPGNINEKVISPKGLSASKKASFSKQSIFLAPSVGLALRELPGDHLLRVNLNREAILAKQAKIQQLQLISTIAGFIVLFVSFLFFNNSYMENKMGNTQKKFEELNIKKENLDRIKKLKDEMQKKVVFYEGRKDYQLNADLFFRMFDDLKIQYTKFAIISDEDGIRLNCKIINAKEGLDAIYRKLYDTELFDKIKLQNFTGTSQTSFILSMSVNKKQ